MRKLMWFTLGVALICAMTAYLNIWITIVTGFVSLACGAVCILLCSRIKPARILAVVCVGLAVGAAISVINDKVMLQYARNANNQLVQISARLTDYAFETDYGSAAQVELQIDGRRFSAQLYFDEELALKPGDRVQGAFRLRFTGGSDSTHHFGKGILLLGYQQDEISIDHVDRIPISLYPAMLRYRIIEMIDRLFPADTAFFARALLLGDRTDVDYELNTAFKVTGISHIIAVSGMHVSILASVVYVLAAKKRWLMALLGIPTVLLFAAIAGFTPSITRACMMQILLLVALILDRDYDPLTALSFAALVMLANNPMVITSVSFQLSFGCMAGIFLFSSSIYQWMCNFSLWRGVKPKTVLGFMRGWLAGSVSVTLGAMVFTTALCALHFGSISLIGILTNLLLLWLVGLIFPGIIAACIVSIFHAGAGGGLAWVISWPIRLLVGFIKWLADFPIAAIYTKSIFVVIWIVFLHGMIIIFLALKKKHARIMICAGVLSLCVSLLASWLIPYSSDVRMTVLDVGQGQSIILTAKGRTFLIDCGGDYDADAADLAAETLLSQGIFRLDGVILTHYDRDHAGGICNFLSRITVDRVFLPDTNQISVEKEQIEKTAMESSVIVGDDLRIQWEDCVLEIFAPVLSNSDNESGISVLFSWEKCDILITGDMNTLGEALLLGQRQLPKLEALVVGHHGSKHSTGDKLLEATKPEVAIISVGKDNSYGHPAKEVLDRLESYGCQVRRTDMEGTIVFRR